jgi:TATA-box binding protein (TBP) (component of TFIID and TFIIIB)
MFTIEPVRFTHASVCFRLMKYSKVELGPCAGRLCQHQVKALPVGTRMEPPQWEDLGVKEVFDIIQLILENQLHTSESPHPMWSHLSESKKTFITPNRSYNKKVDEKKKKVPRSERLRREREQSILQTPPSSASSSDAKREASKSPPRKKQKTEQSQFRYQPRRAGAKNKKKKKRPNNSGRIGTLDIQQVVAKGKTGNVPADLADLRFNGLAGRYIPPRFPAATVNLAEPQCTISQHVTGELGITGAANEYAAIVAKTLYALYLANKSNTYIDISAFRPVNFTTRGYIGLPLDLAQFAKDFEGLPGFSVCHEPSQIESVQMKPMQQTSTDGSVTTAVKYAANLFRTGNICVVGFRNKETIKECEETFVKLVREWAELQQQAKEAAAANSETPRASC